MWTIDQSPYARSEEPDLKAEARFKAFAALKRAWKHRSERDGLRAADLAEKLGRDKGHVSRVLSGKHRSINLDTLAVFLEALGYDLQISSRPLEEIPLPNHDARPLKRPLESFAPSRPTSTTNAALQLAVTR